MEYTNDECDTVGIYLSDIMKKRKEKTHREQYGKIPLLEEGKQKK